MTDHYAVIRKSLHPTLNIQWRRSRWTHAPSEGFRTPCVAVASHSAIKLQICYCSVMLCCFPSAQLLYTLTVHRSWGMQIHCWLHCSPLALASVVAFVYWYVTALPRTGDIKHTQFKDGSRSVGSAEQPVLKLLHAFCFVLIVTERLHLHDSCHVTRRYCFY